MLQWGTGIQYVQLKWRHVHCSAYLVEISCLTNWKPSSNALHDIDATTGWLTYFNPPSECIPSDLLRACICIHKWMKKIVQNCLRLMFSFHFIIKSFGNHHSVGNTWISIVWRYDKVYGFMVQLKSHAAIEIIAGVCQ